MVRGSRVVDVEVPIASTSGTGATTRRRRLVDLMALNEGLDSRRRKRTIRGSEVRSGRVSLFFGDGLSWTNLLIPDPMPLGRDVES